MDLFFSNWLTHTHTHTHTHTYIYIYIYIYICSHFVIVTVLENGHINLSLNPRRGLHPWKKLIQLFSHHLWVDWAKFINLGMVISLGKGKTCLRKWPCVTSCSYTEFDIYHRHHHVVLAARISLTLSHHFYLSFIASGRFSGQHPVSSHSCWMYVRAGRPAFARPCVGIHKSTSLMSSSLLLQQCLACLVRLTWIVFGIGGRWPCIWCLVGCCRQDLFKIARSILV